MIKFLQLLNLNSSDILAVIQGLWCMKLEINVKETYQMVWKTSKVEEIGERFLMFCSGGV